MYYLDATLLQYSTFWQLFISAHQTAPLFHPLFHYSSVLFSFPSIVSPIPITNIHIYINIIQFYVSINMYVCIYICLIIGFGGGDRDGDGSQFAGWDRDYGLCAS